VLQNPKIDITRKVLALVEIEQTTVEEAMRSWWLNFRSSGGYRLTHEGFSVFKNTFESYTIEIENPKSITSQVLLQLDKRINYPYYIEKRGTHVHLFGSKEAMMVALYGDIVVYLKNLSN